MKVLAGALCVLLCGPAWGHEWYQGLTVPGSAASCCNDRDCAPVEHRFTETGVEILIRGVWIEVDQDRYVASSPDGRWHACVTPGGQVRCLIPPGGDV